MNLAPALLFAALCLTHAGAEEKPEFQATAGRKETRIAFVAGKEALVVDVTSPQGIDKATLKRLTDAWPKAVRVRLRLKGLESFKVQSGETTLAWSVASTGERLTHCTLWKGRQEIPLAKDDPQFTAVTLADGFFEVPLPASLLVGNPPEISLAWIDFYRN